MNLMELSPEGNFESWENTRLNILKSGELAQTLNHLPTYENNEFRMWYITLNPKERLPFRKVTNDFSYTFLSEGFGVIHQGNGEIKFAQFKKGDVYYYNVKKNGEFSQDFQNVSLEAVKLMVFELK